jgi:plasmid stabilization system protein ParE
LDFYESEGGRRAGDRFFDAVENAISRVVENPRGFPFAWKENRRVPIDSFPYHFLYREEIGGIYILVLRHDKRHPGFGLSRR